MQKVDTERYVVKPGKKVKREKWDADDSSGFDGDEEDARKYAASLDKMLDALQEKLYAEQKHKVLVVLQAMDTGGKDGTIRRIFQGVNPSGVHVVHFREPTPEELEHDFLWRIHPKVPGDGEIVIFNRSHYEDVLVPKVHKLVPKKVLKERYRQINDFERALTEQNMTILKFYLHIDKEEQKKRIEERLQDPTKEWKFSDVDLHERRYWDEYMKAYEQLLERTSTEWAPWFFVPSNRKWFRDVLVSSVMVKSLTDLDMKYPRLSRSKSSIVIP